MSARRVKYRSIQGDIYEAMLIEVGEGIATVDVKIPGCSAPLRRSRITFPEVDTGERGIAFLAPERVTAGPASQLGRRGARAARVASKAAGRS